MLIMLLVVARVGETPGGSGASLTAKPEPHTP
jgi:hypothetical protein